MFWKYFSFVKPLTDSNARGWLTGLPIAHRGLHDIDKGIPENSMKAFEQACQAGVAIELDLQTTEDGEIVVFHDLHLRRLTGVDKKITGCTWEELSTCRLQNTDQFIPKLADVLRLVNGRVPLLIEIKSARCSGRTEQEIWNLLRPYKGLYAVQSFNPFSIGWFARHAPEVVRGQLSCRYTQDIILSWSRRMLANRFLFFFRSKPNFIAYEVNSLPSRRIDNMRKKGMTVLAWTVQTKNEFLSCLPYADNVIFENLNVDDLSGLSRSVSSL